MSHCKSVWTSRLVIRKMAHLEKTLYGHKITSNCAATLAGLRQQSVNNGGVCYGLENRLARRQCSFVRKMASGHSSPRVNGMDRVPKPFIIGVAGGTASGKSSVCNKIMEQLDPSSMEGRQRRVAIINQDAFYKNLNETEIIAANKGEFNFDHPDAFDVALMVETLKLMRAGRRVNIPKYNYIDNAREEEGYDVGPADVILFEGILVFYYKEIRDMFNMKLFVDTDADTRLSRRVLRDIQDRGRDLEHILHQYTSLVKPAFEEFCLPTKKYADVIIPRGADNVVAIDLIVQHIQEILHSQPVRRIRHNSDSFVGRPH